MIKLATALIGPAAEKIYEQMLKGDPRSSIPLGARVMKVQEDAPNSDVNTVGSLGTVKGSIHHEEHGDAYLVKFDSCSQGTFMIGDKIIQI